MGMKDSTIKKVLRARLEAWSATITDEKVRNAVRGDTIVSGGAIASMIMGDPINDFDLYFRTKATTILVTQYYINQFNAIKGQLKHKAAASVNPELREAKVTNLLGIEEERVLIYMKSSGVAGEEQGEYAYFEHGPENKEDDFFATLQQQNDDFDFTAESANSIEVASEVAREIKGDVGIRRTLPDYRPVFLTDNAITLSDQFQLVIRFFGEPVDIHANYDFAHAMCHYDWGKDELSTPLEALRSMHSKELVYKGSLYPLCSLFRLRKFIGRGWRITAGQMLKIAHQTTLINFNDPAMLREQLMGVDMAYMHELISVLSKEKGKIDHTYLAKLIDTVFDG
jgi:hypothetical protein